MGEVVVITSGKGGVGKTTTTANLGAALAMTGKSVVVVDGDIGLRNLDVALGLENKIVYDLVDVIEKRCRLRQAVLRHPEIEGLFLLPASQTRNKEDVSKEGMQMLCRALEEQYDYVLIDCPAGIDRGFENAAAGAKRAIVVTVPEPAAVRDADRVVGQLELEGIHDRRLVIARMRSALAEKGAILRTEEIIEWLAIELLGVIPEDEAVLTMRSHQKLAVQLDCMAGAAYKNVAARILGQHVPLLIEKPKKRFFSFFRKKRK